MKRLISTINLSKEEWLRYRKCGITGTDAGAILGLNPYRSAFQVYHDKISDTIENIDSEAMRQGRDLEEYVAQRFTEATGLKVRRANAIYQNEEHPLLLADFDRLIVGQKAGLECKTVSPFSADKWADGKIPAHYMAQVNHYLAVSGFDCWYIAALIFGKELVIHKIISDKAVLDNLIAEEEHFWKYNVMPEIAPTPTGSEGDTQQINQMYFDDDKSKTADLNKVKRILQWFIGGCYILSGLAYIGEYTMPAIILIILGGVIILPPITKRIPAFKFKKIALILLSSIVMIAGIQLGETNLSPEVLAKRKAESEAAAASQAALEAQEAAESASRAAEEEAASKAAQEKAESEAAVATENEIASMKAMILKDCNLSDIPRDDKNQMANADEKNFYAAWKEAAAEKIAEKNQGNNAEDLVRITFEQMVDFYKKIYPDSTLINTEKGILESIDSASSEMEEAKTSDLGYSVEDAELYEGKFYIYKRMETHYDDTLLGSLQKELDSFNTSKAIEWLAYDVDYLMGEAYPGETAYVLITEDEYTFSKQGAYKLTYVDTGKTTELVDDQGFRWEASVYFVVDEDTYNENLQKMFRAEQALYDTYERILNNFGLAE